MSTNVGTKQKYDRALGCLLGGVAGMLFSCCLGVAALMLFESSSTVTAPLPPSVQAQGYDIEAVVEEDYINRSMLEQAAGVPSPLPLVAGHLDLRPGGQADFVMQMEAGPLRPVFRGVIAFRATEAGEIEMELIEVRVGYLPVTALVPAAQLDAVNQAVNLMLTERSAAMGSVLRVVDVRTEETRLRIYFVTEL